MAGTVPAIFMSAVRRSIRAVGLQPFAVDPLRCRRFLT